VTDLLEFLKTVNDGVLCYSVSLEYGQQEPGLDDTGQSDDERQIRVIARPAGFLAGVVIVWQGNLAEILALDPFDPPTVVPNPPRDAIFRGPYDMLPGAFCWGDAVETPRVAEKLAERRKRWEKPA